MRRSQGTHSAFFPPEGCDYPPANARDRFGKHLPAWHEKAMQINKADVAELVDARDLKSPGATEIPHLSHLTREGNPHEAGRDPAVLSNTPPLPLATSGQAATPPTSVMKWRRGSAVGNRRR